MRLVLILVAMLVGPAMAQERSPWLIEDRVSAIDGKRSFGARYSEREAAFVVNWVDGTAGVGLMSESYSSLSNSTLALMRFGREEPMNRVWRVWRGQVLLDNGDARDILRKALTVDAFHIRVAGTEVSVPMAPLKERQSSIRASCGL